MIRGTPFSVRKCVRKYALSFVVLLPVHVRWSYARYK